MKTLLALLCFGVSLPATAQTTYSDKRYGITFKYPAGYVLKEGILDDQDIGLGYLGPTPMEFTARGGIRVVTVEMPTGSLPGTDFVNAFFTVSVNSFLTPAECGHFLDSRGDTPRWRTLLLKIGNVEFQGFRVGFGGLGHQFSGTYLHGYLNGSCYELGYGLATAGYGAVEGMRHVDDRKILSMLEKIRDSMLIRRR